MTIKRRVLSALGKQELLELGRRLELEVRASMKVDEIVDVLAGSKRVGLERIVTERLSREALKAICESCGLDSKGKEKGPLVARILAAATGGNGNGEHASNGGNGAGQAGLPLAD